MTFNEAKVITEELGAIGGFPSWSPAAVNKIADFVQGVCRTAAEAQRLIDRAVETYTKWDQCGVPGLRSLLTEVKEGEPAVWQPDYSTAEPISCFECFDTGAVLGPEASRWEKCSCSAGDQEQASELNRIIDQAQARKRQISAEERSRRLSAMRVQQRENSHGQA